MSTALIELLRAVKPEAILGSHAISGDATVLVAREHLLDLMQFLRDDPRCRMEQLLDVTAVDFLEYTPHMRVQVSPVDAPADGGAQAIADASAALSRFEVVYHLLSITLKHRLRVKVPLAEDDIHVQSMCGLWISANYGERETWDMYGIQFDGHPDPRRILLYQEFEGHPLRKDYPLRGYQPLVPMPELVHYTDHETFR